MGTLQLTMIPGLSRHGMLRAQIEGVRVSSGQRGQGLGRRMIEWAIDAARGQGCGLVQLTSDKRRPMPSASMSRLASRRPTRD